MTASHSGGGATTLHHYADPVSEVDWRAAALPRSADRRTQAHLLVRQKRAVIGVSA